MVKNPPCNAGDMASIPRGWTKIPPAAVQLSPCTIATELVHCSERSRMTQLRRNAIKYINEYFKIYILRWTWNWYKRLLIAKTGLPWWLSSKASACNAGDIKMQVQSLHSSILVWEIPWTEEPGRIQSMGSQRVGHNWSDLAHTSNITGPNRVIHSGLLF